MSHNLQITMSAKISRASNVTLTRYAPILKELTFVAVFVVTKETAGSVQVMVLFALFKLKFSQELIEPYTSFSRNNDFYFLLRLVFGLTL